MDIYDLIEAIQEEQVRITDHADEEAVEDDLTFDEIYFSILFGEIIEQYPNNKPYSVFGIHLGQNRDDKQGRVGILLSLTVSQSAVSSIFSLWSDFWWRLGS